MSRAITVTTGARLHLGPLSYRPQQGRHFGGVGVMIEHPGFKLTFSPSEVDRVVGDNGGGEGETAARVRRFVSCYRDAVSDHRLPAACEVTIDRELPSHGGLGSGTQLGLAVARGLSTLAGEQQVTAVELARRVGRGRRSAIGIHGFASGGLIVDAGQTADDEVGALACRVTLPENWRVLIITPQESASGLSGEGEERAFETLGSMPTALTDRLCRIVLTELLPAVQEADFAAFSGAVFEYGRLVGEFFAPVQGGIFGHPRTDDIIAQLQNHRIRGAGQTSWGPTVFAFVPNESTGDEIRRALTSTLPVDVCLVPMMNRGATVAD